MINKELKYTEIVTDNGNKYVRFKDSHTIFTKEILNSPKRQEHLRRLNLIKKDDFFDEKEISQENVRKTIFMSGLQQLILEVTSACNFRCKYCVFGGNYELMRSHQTTNMSWETAKKAIDYYFEMFKVAEEYNYIRIPTVNFYGGEPLLNYALIKQCVLYINAHYSQFKPNYSMTTNGSLLNDEIIDFINTYKINVMVSLDGPEEEHDRNRIYKNGKGTFRDVYKNIIKLSKKIGKPVFTNCVYDWESNIEQISNFYDSQDRIICLLTTPVKSIGSHYYDKFTVEQKNKFFALESKMKRKLLDEVAGDSGKILNFLDRYFVDRCASFFVSFIDMNENNNKLIKCTGACIPGHKIFVSVKGEFFVCEKASQQFPIGDINCGLDMEKICDLLRKYQEATVECKFCDFRNECSVCNMVIEEKEGFLVTKKLCNSLTLSKKEQYKLALDLCEKDPEWTKTAISVYYKTIGEEVKNLL